MYKKLIFLAFVSVQLLVLFVEPVKASGSITGPGDIAFVGFNADGTDGFAFVLLGDATANQVIYFTDNEWDGSSFNSGEGNLTWTAPDAGAIAGTVVYISDTSGSAPVASIGTASGSNVNLSSSNEALFAYLGTQGNPSAFVSAIANDDFSAAGATLSNTGLTAGTDAIELDAIDSDADIAAYTGSRTNQSTAAAYRSQIHDLTNTWISQDGGGDQSNDGTAPDVPFDTTSFTQPNALTLTLFSARSTNHTPLLALASAALLFAAIGWVLRRGKPML